MFSVTILRFIGFFRGSKHLFKRKMGNSSSRSTDIITASRKGQAWRVRALLRMGTSANATDDCDRTALWEAANGGHFHCAELLVRAGADVDARGPGGHTPLMRAAIAGSWRIIHVLLAAGASHSARNNRGQTAYALAEANCHIVATAALDPKWLEDEEEDEDDGNQSVGKYFKEDDISSIDSLHLGYTAHIARNANSIQRVQPSKPPQRVHLAAIQWEISTPTERHLSVAAAAR